MWAGEAPVNSSAQKRVWLEVDLAELRKNFCKIRETVAPCDVIGVLKANAYGLGVGPIAAALTAAGCRRFGVAELSEALDLRDSGTDVQILGGVLPDEIPPAVEAGVCLPVGDRATAVRISEWAVKLGRDAECQFLIDTGMGRLGILPEDALAVIRDTLRLPGFRITGIYSHFPAAYRGGDEYTNRQIESFVALLDELRGSGIEFKWRHIANSDAVNNFPRAYANPFNAVRTGINLHGCFDPEGRRVPNLKSIFTLKSRLIAVRRLRAGSFIGYGCSCRLERDALVGVVAAGYADGLPLALSNCGSLLVRGQACPILGRVSMDYTTVSLENVPDAVCGDEVVCLGRQGEAEVSVDEWAALKGSHAYDIICSFGTRVERVFVGRNLKSES